MNLNFLVFLGFHLYVDLLDGASGGTPVSLAAENSLLALALFLSLPDPTKVKVPPSCVAALAILMFLAIGVPNSRVPAVANGVLVWLGALEVSGLLGVSSPSLSIS
jgi:hypothetical protein